MKSARGSLRLAQLRTIALLFGGYAACYYCRADLSVATPLLVEELGRHGVSHGDALIRIGSVSSLGIAAYAIGKLFLTGLGDYWGGRRNFLIGVGGAAVFTLMFAAGGSMPIFTVAWIGNRLTQSLGWAGLIKVSSKWFDYSSYGSIIGILSISYLVGDALARQQMGVLIGHGYGWRAVFLFAAGGHAARKLPVAARIACRGRTPGGNAQPAQSFCRNRVTPCECRCLAAAAAAQPCISAGLRVVVYLHNNPRDLQHLDSGVPARSSRIQHEPRRGAECAFPRGGSDIGAARRMAE
jgi:MFS family permease